MSTERWNDDIAYVFSIHKIFLRIYGMWPLQTQTLFTRIRWSLCLIAQIMMIPFLMLDLIYNQNANTGIEDILLSVGVMLVIMKHLCIGLSQKKLNININGAIDDWLSVKNDKETQKIMKKYAYIARVLTLMLLYSTFACVFAYVLVILFINLKQIFFTDSNLLDANTTNWILLLPCGPLSKSITGSQYVIILTIQFVQTVMACSVLFLENSFFFNITMHLAGQLEVLKNKFQTFANKPNTEANYRKKFIRLINRHSKLMEFYQNLEDSFNLCILIELVTVTIVLAFIGLRINLCLMESNYIEVAKNSLVVNSYLIESLVLTYAGDFLQRESEGIFYAIYATSWFTLPLTLMKDMHFAMMKSSIPFRFTGGKFFYVNRETMMNILKTAASYVSVLRIALVTN
ncbi:Odorant receptor 271 [Nylanderia fulva]|uniref:Odorant receptor n=1 Tax=Nylanderia fulva TaxID=613905 RepID=A0A6G1LQF9_9HYME|nr:odorant receptor 13a-like [Nylanderia fulva]KAF3054474.1 Odorant receptor 271 [Nylanderia fulva]